MAKISLRAYNHEIGNLIDHGQTEEASAHCKYILKIFPKHLDTYRLLGKAYLESQRYSEASDILQRVLAVVPDDFVSQIGLSIIREDEGNLDAAIWNMERAFEVQPSNAAVQEELRRLYGNRDGVQPPRVRLTRGALVRMYTKGNLYQQAIAEARAAIAESPKRTDLEILLARNYYLSKNFVEATDICSRLVKKMPYCYEANLILADILPKTNKAEEAKIFAKRVQELDPYAAFTDRSASTSAQVPDDAVTLEKLEWQPSMEDAEQPRWAKSIGVDIDSQSDQPSTDWLSDLPEDSPESSAPMPFIIPQISADKSEGSLPGWMKEDEWSTGEDAETPIENQQSSAFIMDDAEDLQEAEIPEWLQSMAPDEIDQGQPAASPSPFEMPAPESSDAYDWTNGLIGDTPAFKDPQPVSDTPFLDAEPAGDEDVPEWMQDMSAAKDEEPPDELPLSTLPDFSVSESDDLSFDAETTEEDTPDWLKDLESSVSQPAEQTDMPEAAIPSVTDMLGKPTQEPEVPDWLNDIEQDDTTLTPPESPSAAAQADEVPDWLQDFEGAADQPTDQSGMIGIPMPGVTDMLGKPTQEPEVPDWLNDIEQDDTTLTPPESPSAAAQADEVPDWLQDFEGAADQPTDQSGMIGIPMPGVTDMLGKPTQEPEVPDWLNDIDSGPEAASEPADDLPDDIFTQQEAETRQAADEMPDWLQELEPSESAIQPDAERTIARSDTPASSDQIPDWEQADDETSNIEAALPAAVLGVGAMIDDGKNETQNKTLPQESEEMPEDPDEAFAWLESLAAQQGADEEALSTPMEERDTTVPDWLQELDQTAPETFSEPESLYDSDETPSDSAPALDEPVSDDSLPDWLHDLDEAGIAKQPEQKLSPAAESEPSPTTTANGEKFTDWLNGLNKDGSAAEQPAEENEKQETTPFSDAAPAQPVSSTSLPDWLRDFSDASTSEPEPETPGEPVFEESPISDSLAEEQPADNVSVPDWLNDLAEEEPEQAVDDASMESLQELQITLPDWMQSEDQITDELTPAAKSASIPDWLEELKPADSEQTTADRINTRAPSEPAAELEHPDPTVPSVSSDDETLVLSHKAQEEAQPQESEEMPADADDAFAWLESLAAKHGAEEDALVTTTDERKETPPDWVQGLGSTEETLPAEEPSRTGTFSISDLDTGVDLLDAAEEIPADSALDQNEAEAKAQQWLQSLASGKPVEDLETPPADEISPDRVEQPIDQPAETLATPLADEMPSDPAEAFAWLESLAAQQGADEEALSTPLEERDSTTPDWLQDKEKEIVVEEPLPDPGADITVENTHKETLPSNAVDLNPADEMPSDPDEAFAWLESLAAQQGADEEALSTPLEERDSTTPDWLQNIEEEIVVEEPLPKPGADITDENTHKETLPSNAVDLNPADEMPSDPDEAFAWLESLAAQQGADEEALSTPLEERDSTTPDWLQNIEEEIDSGEQPQYESKNVAEDTPRAAQEAEFFIEETLESMDLPDMESQPVAEEPGQTKPQASTSLPEWLKEFEEPVTEETTTIAHSEQQIPQDETVIRWLHDMDEEDNKSLSSAIEPPAPKSAAQEIITEPVKTVSVSEVEEIPDEPQVETGQPIVREPALEIVEEPDQKITPTEEPVAQEKPQVSAPPFEAGAEVGEKSDMLTNAQKLINKGRIEESVVLYKTLITEETQIDAVIKDLNDALLHHPVDTILWLTLGDAYMQKKEMQSALSAYTKAEELLR